MRHDQPHPPKRARNMGFTMLEMVIALGMMGLLVGMVFKVAQSSMMLSQIVVDEQKATMERSAFFNLIKHHFEQIPGNAVMRLERYGASSDRSLFTLTFQNVPMSFNWGETPMTAEALELATVEQRDGFIDVVLRFYDVKILEDSTSTGDEQAEPVAEITLIEDLWHCDCEVVDGSTMEQTVDWDGNKLPLQVKFYCRFDPTADLVEQTFWVVPKENPEVFMRQVMQKNPGGPQVPEGGGVIPETPRIEVTPGTTSPLQPSRSNRTNGRGTSGRGQPSRGGPIPRR